MARVVQPDFNNWAKGVLDTWIVTFGDRDLSGLKKDIVRNLTQAYQQGFKDGRNHNNKDTSEGTPA